MDVPFLIKPIQITFDSIQLESKFILLREAKSTLVIIQKSQSRGSSLLDQKCTRFEKTSFFFKNVAISLENYPKDIKFSEYEELIHRKICPGQLKTKSIFSGLQSVVTSHSQQFMLIFDDDISA